MDEQKIKIKSFTGLIAWQEGHKKIVNQTIVVNKLINGLKQIKYQIQDTKY